jgi:hypothetical protein
LTGTPIGGALVPDVLHGSYTRLQIFCGVEAKPLTRRKHYTLVSLNPPTAPLAKANKVDPTIMTTHVFSVSFL